MRYDRFKYSLNPGTCGFDDAQCLKQAIMISQMNKVDLNEIWKWAHNGNQPDKFQKFEKGV